MGSQHSFLSNKEVIDKLQEYSPLFSYFCSHIKQNFFHDDTGELLSEGFPLDCDVDSMESIVHLWCIKCLSKSRWNEFNFSLKNQLVQDFLDTLYCTSHSFDEVFLLLFTSAKSRTILGLCDRAVMPPSQLRIIVEDILKYSSAVGLKYYSTHNGVRCQESITDYPLKTFSLCPCTRRPLYVAMYLGKPDVVQLLLKYGARIPYEDVCNCMEDSRHPLKNVMDILRTTSMHKTNAQATKASVVQTKRNILSLKLVQVDLRHTSSLWANVCDVIQQLDATVGKITVPPLKHICRASIRQIMKGNSFLYHSNVWSLLNIPQTLISYMNIDYCNSLCQE